MFEGSLAGLMVIVGPLVLLAALAWAVLHNRRSRGQEQRTEQATRDLYKEQGRADSAGEGG